MGQDGRVRGPAVACSLYSRSALVVNYVAVTCNIAESLRGPFKPSEYGSVVPPLTVLRRLDAVLSDTKPEVLKVAKATEDLPEKPREVRGLSGPSTRRRCRY
ncbi:type I restriction-modification system subunit M N-terminal domain-containing protein [Microbacterium sp. JZ101]